MARRPSARLGGAGLLALAATYGIGRLAYGLFVPAFRQEFDLAVDVVGLYASAAQAGYLVAAVATGLVAARLGPRAPVVAGCVTLSLAAVTVALAPGAGVLAVGLVAAGVSAGGTWAPFSDAVAEAVPDGGRRHALALVNAGAPAGLLVASLAVLATGSRWRLAWWGFAALGLVAAVAAWRVLPTGSATSRGQQGRPSPRWFVGPRSARLFAVAVGLSLTCGAFLAHAPDTAVQAGLGAWIGPAMWAVLGFAGAGLGSLGGRLAERLGLRMPLAATLVLVAAASLLLLAAPGRAPLVLAAAALFGTGYTTAYALLVMWSQEVFADHPTS
ncbi:MAG: MFS transporter, partial [Nitriliruptoraceae bacterium]